MTKAGGSPTLALLLRGVEGALLRGGREQSAEGIAIAEVRDDSRRVQRGDLFVAVPGAQADGRRFIADAIARGAAAIVLEGEHPEELAAFAGTVVEVANARGALARIAANRFGAAEALSLLAVTGTNGKTTTTYIVESMLRAAGASPGVIGTVTYRGAGLPAGGRPAPLTTPGALELHALFAEMRAGGATDVVSGGFFARAVARTARGMRVPRGRADEPHAGPSRLSRDDGRLFRGQGDLVRAARRPDARRFRHLRRRRGRPPHARARDAALGWAWRGRPGARRWPPTWWWKPRRSALAASARRCPRRSGGWRSPRRSSVSTTWRIWFWPWGWPSGAGYPPKPSWRARRTSRCPGRLERVMNDRGVLCVVDYAHTPDALERAIAAMRPLVGTGGRLMVVFGCGGDRDRGKRPIMGEIAARDADIAIVTSDNPRTEDPAAIVAAILDGVRRVGAPMLAASALAEARRGTHVRGGSAFRHSRGGPGRAARRCAAGRRQGARGLSDRGHDEDALR